MVTSSGSKKHRSHANGEQPICLNSSDHFVNDLYKNFKDLQKNWIQRFDSPDPKIGEAAPHASVGAQRLHLLAGHSSLATKPYKTCWLKNRVSTEQMIHDDSAVKLDSKRT